MRKILIKAKPGAKEAYVKKLGGGGLFDGHANLRIGTKIRMEPDFIVAVKERAVQGKANRAIESALAAYFKVPISSVTIVSGHTAREKMVEIGD